MNCITCSKPLVGRQLRFCSDNCRKRDWNKKNNGKALGKIYLRECPHCHVLFQTNTNKKIYCTIDCQRYAHKKRSRSNNKVPCEFCGFDNARALHLHHINRAESKGVMSLCANCHYIFHSLIGRGKKAESRSREDVLEVLKAQSPHKIYNKN